MSVTDSVQMQVCNFDSEPNGPLGLKKFENHLPCETGSLTNKLLCSKMSSSGSQLAPKVLISHHISLVLSTMKTIHK